MKNTITDPDVTYYILILLAASIFQIALQFYLYHYFVIENNLTPIVPVIPEGMFSFVLAVPIPVLWDYILSDHKPWTDCHLFRLLSIPGFTGSITLIAWWSNTLNM